MKKAVIFSSLFAITFSLALGITVMLTTDNAHAIWQCSWECTYRTWASSDPGDGVICPVDAYYVYKQSTCAGGPLNCENHKWIVGCAWPGVPFWRVVFPPVLIW
ncbi:MAG: hypothetical protein R3F48_16520 [Candidatus Zixiibacteriota bacterium]